LRAVLAGHGSGDGPVGIAAGVAEPLRLELDRVAGELAQARKLGLRIHAHAGSDPSQNGVVSDLAQKGLLGPDVTLVHCLHLDEADFDSIASSGASVSLAPSSEMARGSGSPLVQRLLDRDIRPGLGIDDERVAPGDMFGPMRETIALQHATYFDRKLAGKGGLPNLLTTREVIRYATSDGARVAGLEQVTGSLEPGKKADIILLRTDRPNIYPINDPIGAVVWGMDTSNIDWVLVEGRTLVSNGALSADVGRARDLALAAQRKVGLASGLLVEAATGGSG
ncbi:MAG: amidohydrolase family protein, partial [Acidimicrobiia bacterium]